VIIKQGQGVHRRCPLPVLTLFAVALPITTTTIIVLVVVVVTALRQSMSALMGDPDPYPWVFQIQNAIPGSVRVSATR